MTAEARARWALLVAAGLMAAGCGSDDGADGGAAAPDDIAAETADGDGEEEVGADARTGEGWTVLVYSMADTDLEPFLLADVAEMAEVGTQDGLNVVALVDRAEADYSTEPLLNEPDWTGAKLLEVGQGEVSVLEEMGDINTGDPQVLADFIARGIEEYPAARYSLVLSDHGAAWPGVGGDESADHDVLTLAEMQDGIAAGTAEAGLDRFDLLGFDACLMATYETASVMAPLADRMLASQELEPGHGWDYAALQVAADDPDVDVDTLGRALVDGFAAQAQAEGTEAEITLSLVDLTGMVAVDEAVESFGAALAERTDTIASVIGAERARVLGFGRSPDPTQDTHMADLAILASEIGVDALDVSDQADAVVRAVNDVVVHSIDGSATRGATGLSIYFPPTAELYDAAYDDVASAQGWAAFLAAYYGAGEAIPEEAQPAPVDPAGGLEITFDPDGLFAVGLFDGASLADVADATIDYALVGEDGSLTYVGREPATVADDGSGVVEGFYDLTTLQISDGQDSALAFLELRLGEDEETFTVDVPMAYFAPGAEGDPEEILLRLTVQVADGTVLNETYYVYDEEIGTFGELTADPAGIIVPQVRIVGPDGSEEWVPTSDVGLFADLPALQYELLPLEPGTVLRVDLNVADFGGNTATLSSDVAIS